MKLRLLLFGLLLTGVAPLFAQDDEVDVTSLLADTKTFIFSNNRNTVKGYIYAELESKTSCCGTDRIYLEVKIDPSGYVLSAKTLTGRNDCFMQSAVDIVKNIKWDTEDFKGGPRSVYFEIKPEIECNGDRENQYVALEIFNNELLNEGENQGYVPPATAATQPQTTQPQSQPVAASPQTTTPATTQPAAPEATEPEAPAEEAPVATADPETTAQPAAAPAEDEPVVVETPEARTEVSNAGPGTLPRREQREEVAQEADRIAAAEEPVELTEEQKEAIAREEEERLRREEEIRQLKEEMARMRAAEEQAREERMAAEQARREREEYSAFGDDDTDFTAAGEGNGGLFMDGQPDDSYDPFASDQVDPNAESDPTASEEQRIRNDIADLEQRIRELEQTNREAEQDIRRRMQEAEQANREIIQLAEEKARREEQAEQLREQRELDRIAQERQRLEDDRARQEAEVQRLTDELARLQSEMQTRMNDLERQKDEIDEVALQRQQREQEIQLERALREKEREAELERKRLELMNSGIFAVAQPTFDPATAMPDFATAADSEKYVILLQQIQALQNEVNYLRQQMGVSSPQTPVGGTPVGTNSGSSSRQSSPSTKPAASGNGNRADQNTDWDDIDYVAPDLNPEDYLVNPRPQPQQPTTSPNQPGTQTQAGQQSGQSSTATPSQDPNVVNYQPGRGYSPDPSHAETHENLPGPSMEPRNYINGETALKEVVKERLRNGGVCGLAHVLYAVTLKPDGQVLNYRILSSNSPEVTVQMGQIIPTLRYNSIDARYNQTIYQEVKAEIICGEGDDVNLQSVQPIIRD